MRLALALLPAALALPRAAAAACEPGQAQVRATIPPDRADGVPLDARIGLWWENYESDPVVAAVQVDGQDWPGRAETAVHQDSASTWTGITLFTPDQPFPAGARVKVEVELDADPALAFSFQVGDAVTTEAIAAPSILRLSVREWPEQPEAPCGQARRQLRGEISGAAEPTQLSWLFLHRATPDGTLGDWFTVLGRADSAPLEFDLDSDELDRDIEAECFTVVQVDPAGGRVSSAEARCATPTAGREPLEDAPASCQAVPTSPVALLALLAAPLARRRRR